MAAWAARCTSVQDEFVHMKKIHPACQDNFLEKFLYWLMRSRLFQTRFRQLETHCNLFYEITT